MTVNALTQPSTIADLLRSRADEVPAEGFRFLRDGAVVDTVTYALLDQEARGIAARLQAAGVTKGSPVLLLYPPGLDFIRAFFACLYAGAAAVPVYPPNPARLARTLPRLRAVAVDCGAKVVLTTRAIRSNADAILPLAPELESATWIDTDGQVHDPRDWSPTHPSASDLALLQYTSGTTGDPRGVMLTHENLIHNQTIIREAFGHKERWLTGVSWLPMYHDMGLIGNVLQPLYVGGSCAMMSPLDFLHSPYRWLAAISELHANGSGAPNFAYDLCTRKVTDEQLAKLDLSSWSVAYCGAEPVRASTLQRFAERFAPAGFKASSLIPCYGLAEASLIVTGASRKAGMTVFSADEDELRNGRVKQSKENGQPIVGCGPAVGDQEVIAVTDGARCEPGNVGEIWIRGKSVGKGYWGKPEETATTFDARLVDGTGPFLRTGDLGAFDEHGELYVVGRTKDLIIVRGLNHYPHDIEQSVEEAWPGLRPGCSVAFGIEGKDGEDLGVVSEYDARAREGVSWDAVVVSIRSAIAGAHEISPRVIAIVAAGQVSKTSSGKIQRSETRRRFLAGELEILHRWEDTNLEPVVVVDDVPLRSVAEIETFLTSWLSESLDRPILRTHGFGEIGLDSLTSVRLVDALGLRVGRELNPALAIDYPSIESLAAYLAEDTGPA